MEISRYYLFLGYSVIVFIIILLLDDPFSVIFFKLYLLILESGRYIIKLYNIKMSDLIYYDKFLDR